MGKTAEEFTHQSIQDTESIVRYLNTLGQGIEKGRLLFCSGKDELVLKPNGLLKLGLKAKRKNGTTKISMRIVWKEGQTPKPSDEPLVITSPDEPAE